MGPPLRHGRTACGSERNEHRIRRWPTCAASHIRQGEAFSWRHIPRLHPACRRAFSVVAKLATNQQTISPTPGDKPSATASTEFGELIERALTDCAQGFVPDAVPMTSSVARAK